MGRSFARNRHGDTHGEIFSFVYLIGKKGLMLPTSIE